MLNPNESGGGLSAVESKAQSGTAEEVMLDLYEARHVELSHPRSKVWKHVRSLGH